MCIEIIEQHFVVREKICKKKFIINVNVIHVIKYNRIPIYLQYCIIKALNNSYNFQKISTTFTNYINIIVMKFIYSKFLFCINFKFVDLIPMFIFTLFTKQFKFKC